MAKKAAPRLSVVTPVFNGATYIVACMDNVRDQGRDDVEHIIVDGGSTDATLELVRERMAQDPRVRLIGGPDHGQSQAMNKGMMAAMGRIVGLLNVDDDYKPGTLAIAIDMFANVPEPAFLWGACEVKVHHQPKADVWVQYPGNLVTWRMALGQRFEFHPVNPSSYFYHRSLHFAAGLYDEAEHYAMDLDFLLRVPRHLKQVLTTRTVLGTYNLLPGTKTWMDAHAGTSDARAQALYQRAADGLSVADRIRYEAARAKMQAKPKYPLVFKAIGRARRMLGS